jgi:tetratricopeptide (TPR) repeat protein
MGKRDDDIDAHRRQSDSLLSERDFGRIAVDINRRLTELLPTEAKYWFRLSLCLKANGKSAEAREAAEEGGRLDPQYLERLELKRRSDALTEEGNFSADALRVNRRLTELDPSRAVYWSRLGSCLESADELEEARNAFSRATEAGSASPVAASKLKQIDKQLDVRREIAAVFEKGGEEALRKLINSLKNVPGKNLLRLEGRRLLYQRTNATVFDWIGLAAEVSKSGEHEQAIGLYREAAKTGKPGARSAALTGVAGVYRRMGQPKRAEALCREVLRGEPENHYALNTLGAALADQKRHEEADHAFESAKRAAQRARGGGAFPSSDGHLGSRGDLRNSRSRGTR